mgnify:FL=1
MCSSDLEKVLTPADLESAREVFITSTTRELLTVTRIEGLNIQGGSAVCAQLRSAFSERVQSYVSPRRKPVYN